MLDSSRASEGILDVDAWLPLARDTLMGKFVSFCDPAKSIHPLLCVGATEHEKKNGRMRAGGNLDFLISIVAISGGGGGGTKTRSGRVW